jgi:hypothetical protein
MVRRKRSQFLPIQPVILTRRMISGIFVRSGSELWSLLKYSKFKLKNQKPIAVDVLFYAYPMVPLLWRSNLAGWYLESLRLERGLHWGNFRYFCKQKYLVFSLKSRGSESLQVQGKLSSCFYFTLKLPAQAAQAPQPKGMQLSSCREAHGSIVCK